MKLLCERKASTSIQDHHGDTPMHTLMRRRPHQLQEKLSILLKYGCKVDLKNRDELTGKWPSNCDKLTGKQQWFRDLLRV